MAGKFLGIRRNLTERRFATEIVVRRLRDRFEFIWELKLRKLFGLALLVLREHEFLIGYLLLKQIALILVFVDEFVQKIQLLLDVLVLLFKSFDLAFQINIIILRLDTQVLFLYEFLMQLQNIFI